MPPRRAPLKPPFTCIQPCHFRLLSAWRATNRMASSRPSLPQPLTRKASRHARLAARDGERIFAAHQRFEIGILDQRQAGFRAQLVGVKRFQRHPPGTYRTGPPRHVPVRKGSVIHIWSFVVSRAARAWSSAFWKAAGSTKTLGLSTPPSPKDTTGVGAVPRLSPAGSAARSRKGPARRSARAAGGCGRVVCET